jgi:hypothetical protein
VWYGHDIRFSDVTFFIDTFSYKKLFHRRLYAKSGASLTKDSALLQKKNMFVNFPDITHGHLEGFYFLKFLSFFSRKLKGDPWEMGGLWRTKP